MRIGFMDSDGNKTIVDATIFSKELTSAETPIVWIITDDAGDSYFSKDPDLLDNFDTLFNDLLKNGYVDLTQYDVYCDVGIDEDEDDDDDEDDDSDDGDWDW